MTKLCAWCGHAIERVPDDSPAAEDSYWWTLPGDRDDLVCYDEQPHIPAEWIIAHREGASHRTADELLALFILEAASILESDGCEITAEMREDIALADTVEGWIDDDDVVEQLHDATNYRFEYALGDAGYAVTWDDGYHIFRTRPEGVTAS